MKVDWRFLAIPLPLLMITLMQFVFLQKLGDFSTHLVYDCTNNYPCGLSSILSMMDFMPRDSALFLVSIFFAIYLPFVLIFEITKNIKAAWIYIYASSIPFMLTSIWFVPQAIIQSLMLLSVWNPLFLLLFLATGWFFHLSWWVGWLLAFGFVLYRKYKERIEMAVLLLMAFFLRKKVIM